MGLLCGGYTFYGDIGMIMLPGIKALFAQETPITSPGENESDIILQNDSAHLQLMLKRTFLFL